MGGADGRLAAWIASGRDLLLVLRGLLRFLAFRRRQGIGGLLVLIDALARAWKVRRPLMGRTHPGGQRCQAAAPSAIAARGWPPRQCRSNGPKEGEVVGAARVESAQGYLTGCGSGSGRGINSL